MKEVLALVMILSFNCCGTSDSNTGVNNDIGLPNKNSIAMKDQTAQTDLGLSSDMSIDTICAKTDSIVIILSGFIQDGNVSVIDQDLLYNILIQNHNDESACHFPRTGGESDLINMFILKLLDYAEYEEKAILLLFYTFDACRRNIELVEFIQSKLAKLILENTQGYINMLLHLDSKQKVRAIGLTEFIKTKEKLVNLKTNIWSYKNTENSKIIKAMDVKLAEEIRRR